MSEDLLPLDEAFARINQIPALTRTETLPLSAALYGRYLAKAAHAQNPVPPFANAAVDGYALCDGTLHAETLLPIAQRITAGAPAHDILEGTASEIFTGAALPANTQSVIMREDTERLNNGEIRLLQPAKHGAHMRHCGEDFAQSATIADTGTRLNSRPIAALAIAGQQRVCVFRSLRIGVFSGGNELHQDPTSTLAPSTIHDSNRPALCALLHGLGHTATDLGVLRDDAQTIPQFLERHHRQYDLLIGSAGMSQSNTDHTVKAMKKMGEMLFWQLAIKPARPIGLARLSHDGGDCFLLGLPGNPASCLLGAWLIGQALINRLYGGKAALPTGYLVKMGFDFPKKPHRQEFVRVWLEHTDDAIIAHRALPAGSATLSSMLQADGILDLKLGTAHVAQGDYAHFYPFPEHL